MLTDAQSYRHPIQHLSRPGVHSLYGTAVQYLASGVHEGQAPLGGAEDMALLHAEYGLPPVCVGRVAHAAQELCQPILGGGGDRNQLVGAAGMVQKELRRKGGTATGGAADAYGMLQIYPGADGEQVVRLLAVGAAQGDGDILPPHHPDLGDLAVALDTGAAAEALLVEGDAILLILLFDDPSAYAFHSALVKATFERTYSILRSYFVSEVAVMLPVGVFEYLKIRASLVV